MLKLDIIKILAPIFNKNCWFVEKMLDMQRHISKIALWQAEMV